MFSFRASTRFSALVSAAAPVLACAALVAVSTVALTGCGTGGDDNKSFNNGGAVITPSPSPVPVTFAGRTYTGQNVTLRNGQTASLTFTTRSDGTASGTVTINDPTRNKTSRLVISTPIVSGTFNPQTGAINLTGSYTVGGQTFNIVITGTLPVPPAFTGGSLTYTINGQSYTTTFGGGITPSPSPSASPSPSPSPSAGTASFTGTITSGSNVTAGAYSAESANGTYLDDNTAISVSFTSATVSGGTVFARGVVASYDDSAAGLTGGAGLIAVGKDLPVSSNGDKRGRVTYIETVTVPGSSNSQRKTFIAESGSFTVIERTDARVRVRLNNLRMVPAPNQTGDLATGAFTPTGDGSFTP